MLHDLDIEDTLKTQQAFLTERDLIISQKRWENFEKLGDVLLDYPCKMLSAGMYWNDILSVFIPTLKMLETYKSTEPGHENYRDNYNRLSIASRNFPKRDQILKEMHKYFLKVEDFMLIQGISENSEEIIQDIKWEAMDVFKYKLSVERRYYFMVQVLTDKLFFIKALRSLQKMFTYKIVKQNREHQYTEKMFAQLFSIDEIWNYPDNGMFWREKEDDVWVLDVLDFSYEVIN